MKTAKEVLNSKGIQFPQKRSPRDYNLCLLAMEEYAKIYHQQEVKKIHKPLVIGSVSFADALAFAEYFCNNFYYYACNANGRVYQYIDLLKRRQTAMTMEQIFKEWRVKETDR